MISLIEVYLGRDGGAPSWMQFYCASWREDLRGGIELVDARNPVKAATDGRGGPVRLVVVGAKRYGNMFIGGFPFTATSIEPPEWWDKEA